MTTDPRQDPSADPDLELGRVRTSADVATWLLQQSRAYEAEATIKVAADEAHGLRLAASTLETCGTVLRDYPVNTALAAKLSSLADEYRHPERDLAEPLPEHYRRACTRLGDAFDQLASHLAQVAPLDADRPATVRSTRLAAGTSPEL